MVQNDFVNPFTHVDAKKHRGLHANEDVSGDAATMHPT